ncbi:GNAT family N-acetyltransferase [Saccharibacillus sacchari]|uniref:Acetyltransferase (GNAT) family n=1 Tax=Saccharibacillus sacchari DSM 19268 TaxID=915437 RepID=A0A011A1A8_9BACL|nr:GNAT family N-acetyltransferase [Saccharibacillus sacchari]EXG83302.1 Acetyltransferase (GNAT) family [Saccharibacillus sacchari DSM 19268]
MNGKELHQTADTKIVVLLLPLKASDIQLLAPIAKRSFDDDSFRHTGVAEDGPHGYADGSLLQALAFEQNLPSYRIEANGILSGAIAVREPEDGIRELELFFVDPDFQGQGVALAAWTTLESMYPHTRLWRLETPGYSLRNHAFYERKCGFARVGIRNPGHPRDESLLFEKSVLGDN